MNIFALLGWFVATIASIVVTGYYLKYKFSQTFTASLALGSALGIFSTGIALFFCTALFGNLTFGFIATVCILLFILALKRKGVLQYLSELQATGLIRMLLFDIATSALLIVFLGRLEPYLPEYDGYIHERMVDVLIQHDNLAIPTTFYRPGFLFLVAFAKYGAAASGLLFTKYIFPIIFAVLTIQLIRLWFIGNSKKGLYTLPWLVALCAPLFISQLIYFRAQCVITVLFVCALYVFYLQENKLLRYLFLGITLVSILLFHVFGLFVLLLGIPFMYAEIKNMITWSRREKYLAGVIAILLAMIAWLISSSLRSALGTYASFSSLHLVANPIPAINTPLEIAKYYLHQILFLAMATIIILATSVKAKEKSRGIPKSVYLPLIILFAGAEVFSRLGMNYDPQRFWIFINLGIISLLVHRISRNEISRLTKSSIVLLACISFALVAYAVKTRAKTFTQDDAAATHYVATTCPDCLVLGPEVKYPGFAIKKADTNLFDIAYPGLIKYRDRDELERQLDWINLLTPESIRSERQRKLQERQKIQGIISGGKTLETSVVEEYNRSIKVRPSSRNNLMLYACSNIEYCYDGGLTKQNALLIEQYSFIQKVYENDTVALYRYIPENKQLNPPKDVELIKNMYLGNVDRTEYGTR